jgi:cob(I)alamin adenosyltransferase
MSNKGSKIYTRRGDDGSTLLGVKGRIEKGHLRVEAMGAVDELNSLLGVLLAQEISSRIKPVLTALQDHLFDLGAELAAPGTARIDASRVRGLEQELDTLDAGLPPLTAFVLPGGTPAAAHLHLARAVCRRAERRLCQLAAQEDEAVNEEAIRYLNRMSDLLFVMARTENGESGVTETLWDGSD